MVTNDYKYELITKCYINVTIFTSPHFLLFIFPIQLNVQVRNVTVKNYSFIVCLFRPDTSYIIRLRHRYRGPASPWSQWSNPRQGRTGEDGERWQSWQTCVLYLLKVLALQQRTHPQASLDWKCAFVALTGFQATCKYKRMHKGEAYFPPNPSTCLRLYSCYL